MTHQSLHLTPLNFWLWGYPKDKVYRHRIHNILELRGAITEEFRNYACDDVKLRLEACIARKGRMVDHSMGNRVTLLRSFDNVFHHSYTQVSKYLSHTALLKVVSINLGHPVHCHSSRFQMCSSKVV